MDTAILDPCQPSFTRSLLDCTVVMPSLHGPYGEDGRLQGLLDYLRRPYTCSGVAASAIAADKKLCKLAMTGLGVPTPGWQQPGEDPEHFLSRCGQIMVKPRMGGSSVGMTLVGHQKKLAEAIEQAAATDAMNPLLEQYVPGQAVTVALLQLPARSSSCRHSPPGPSSATSTTPTPLRDAMGRDRLRGNGAD